MGRIKEHLIGVVTYRNYFQTGYFKPYKSYGRSLKSHEALMTFSQFKAKFPFAIKGNECRRSKHQQITITRGKRKNK